MAAEAAQAEIPAPTPPTGTSPEKRALQVEGEGGEEAPPELKRRRECVAALDGVATEASEPGSGLDASFSFQHARGRFVALETTPKFGSFNPPADAEEAGVDVKPAPRSLEADEQGTGSSSASGAKEDGGREVENSESLSVGAPGQGHLTDNNDDPVLSFDHQ